MKTFHSIYGALTFTVIFTRARYWTLSRIGLIVSIPAHQISSGLVLILSYVHHMEPSFQVPIHATCPASSMFEVIQYQQQPCLFLAYIQVVLWVNVRSCNGVRCCIGMNGEGHYALEHKVCSNTHDFLPPRSLNSCSRRPFVKAHAGRPLWEGGRHDMQRISAAFVQRVCCAIWRLPLPLDSRSLCLRLVNLAAI
jgi:hypothetical protein